MKTTIKVGLGIILAGTVLAVVAGNFARNREPVKFKWNEDRDVPLQVQLSPVIRGKIVRTIEAPGKLEADVEVKVSSPLAGRITELRVREGDVVKKDQVLAEISKEPETSSTKTKDERQRTTIRSPRNGIVSALLVKEGDVLSLGVSGLSQAANPGLSALLSQALGGWATTPMTSARIPGMVLMEISDMDTLVVRARVDEANVLQIRPGQKASIHFPVDEKLLLSGHIQRLSPKGIKVGLDSTMFETVIQIDGHHPDLRLGLSVTAEIQLAEKQNVLTIPAQAVVHRRAKDLPREVAQLAQQLEKDSPKSQGAKASSRTYQQVVFVYADGKAACRLVKTGISDENQVEIVSGLNDGEKVVAGPYRILDKIRDGKALTEMIDKSETDE